MSRRQTLCFAVLLIAFLTFTARADEPCFIGAGAKTLDAAAKQLDATRNPAQRRALAEAILPAAYEAHANWAIAKSLGVIAAAKLVEKPQEYHEAFAMFDEAVAVARETGDESLIAMELFNIAYILRNISLNDASATVLHETLDLAVRSKNRRIEAFVHNTLGLIERARTNYAESIAEHRHALEIYEQLGDADSIAGMTNNIGNTYLEIGDGESALAWFEKALALAEKGKNERVIAYALNNIGGVQNQRGDYAKALAAFERSIEIKERINDRSGLAATYTNIGETHRYRGERAAAVQWYEKSIAAARTVGDKWRELQAKSNLGTVAVIDRQLDRALEISQSVLDDARSSNMPFLIAGAATTRGDALRLFGRTTEAIAAYDEAIAATEASREHSIGDAEQRAAFFERRLNAYHGAAQALASTKPAEALRYAEMGRARVLLDLLGSNVKTAAAPHAKPDQAIVEFALSSDETIVFVITGSRIRAHRIAVRETELRDEAEALRNAIAQRDLAARKLCEQMFVRLLGQAWPEIREKKQLVIIPDGDLWQVPFQALRAPDGRYLIEHAAIAYAPSINALAAMKPRRSSGPRTDLVAFSNPALPESERQVRAITAMYGASARSYTGASSTEARVKRESGAARIVHIATHGVLNDSNPMLSNLVLADGMLSAREIAKTTFSGDLVVLSACDTARGRLRPGEGIVGMSWAVFVAGCPSTVVSQWSVDAASTSELMIRFHERLRGGATKSAALRDASLALLKSRETRDPFYWAPFILVGSDAPLTRPSATLSPQAGRGDSR